MTGGAGMPRRQGRAATATRRQSSEADLAAAEALRVAAGVCSRCETTSPALIAVETDGALVAQCLNPVACRWRLRASLAREDRDR